MVIVDNSPDVVLLWYDHVQQIIITLSFIPPFVFVLCVCICVCARVLVCTI